MADELYFESGDPVWSAYLDPFHGVPARVYEKSSISCFQSFSCIQLMILGLIPDE